MRYAYKDLGEQTAGTTVIVRWSGSAANVILLDAVNFSKYQYADGRPFFYDAGGRYGGDKSSGGSVRSRPLFPFPGEGREQYCPALVQGTKAGNSGKRSKPYC